MVHRSREGSFAFVASLDCIPPVSGDQTGHVPGYQIEELVALSRLPPPASMAVTMMAPTEQPLAVVA